MKDPFLEWWTADSHGWGPPQNCAEFKLAQDAWNAALDWARFQTNQKTRYSVIRTLRRKLDEGYTRDRAGGAE